MNAFSYVNAISPKAAVDLVGKKGRFIAGGVDLVNEMKDYILKPEIVVNVKSLPGLNGIQQGGDKWTVGANVSIAELEHHAGLAQVFPGLVQAAREVASPQIRNMSTVGGNLAQHSRCWYYRQPDLVCLKRGGSTCYAREGDNRYHSLFSGNPCISPVASNLSIILTALDAAVNVQRGDQTVRMTLPELYQAAWTNPLAHLSLASNELILNVEIPVKNRKSAYRQVSEKADFDWALVSCAVAGTVTGGKITGARIVLGVVAPIPYENKAANQFLEGKELNEANAAQAADLLLKDAMPFPHNGYKIPIAHAIIRRALLSLISS